MVLQVLGPTAAFLVCRPLAWHSTMAGKKRQKQPEPDSSSESGSDSEVELSLEFDENGRVGQWGGKVNFGFRAFNSAVQLANKPQIAKLHLLQDLQGKSGYSSGETFWLPANAVPRNGLEQMAKDAKGLNENSGAEWWTLVLDPEDAEVGFHWDKDYTVESDCSVNVFPHISTVTYLNSVGAPTLVMDKTAPVQYGDKLNGTADYVWISKPVESKHISFDGRFLHGAPSELLEIWGNKKEESKSNSKQQTKKRKKDSTQPQEMRVTFLVNVWMNHKPVGSVPFEVPNIKSAPESAHLVLNASNEAHPEKFTVDKGTPCKNWNAAQEKKAGIKTQKEDEEGIKVMQWNFKQTKKQGLHVPLPTKKLAASPAHAILIEYNNKLKPEVS